MKEWFGVAICCAVLAGWSSADEIDDYGTVRHIRTQPWGAQINDDTDSVSMPASPAECLQQLTVDGGVKAWEYNDEDGQCTHWNGPIFNPDTGVSIGNTGHSPFSQIQQPYYKYIQWGVRYGTHVGGAFSSHPVTCAITCEQWQENNDEMCVAFVVDSVADECSVYTRVASADVDNEQSNTYFRALPVLHYTDYVKNAAFHRNCNLNHTDDFDTFQECHEYMSGVSTAGGAVWSEDRGRCWLKKLDCSNGRVFNFDLDRTSALQLMPNSVEPAFHYYTHLCLPQIAAFASASYNELYIHRSDLVSAAQCAASCVHSFGCVAFTWQESEQECWLYRRYVHLFTSSSEFDSGCLTGVVQTTVAGFRGPVDQNRRATTHYDYATLAECASACLRAELCVMFHFDYERQSDRCGFSRDQPTETHLGFDGRPFYVKQVDHRPAGFVPYVGKTIHDSDTVVQHSIQTTLRRCEQDCERVSCVAFAFRTDAMVDRHNCYILSQVGQNDFRVVRGENWLLYVHEPGGQGSPTALCGQELVMQGQGNALRLRDFNCTAELPDLSSSGLQHIDLRCTWFQGPLAGSSLPSSLLTFVMQDNGWMAGSVPDVSHTALMRLRLDRSGFSGTISSSMFPSTLVHLSLTGNFLTGTVPLLHTLLALKSVFLSDNNWQECPEYLPAAVTHDFLLIDCAVTICGKRLDPRHMLEIDLADHECRGRLPDLSVFPLATSIDVSGNHFTGRLHPDTLPSSLQQLNVAGNLLTGAVPTSNSLPGVQLDDISGNKWLCPIPVVNGVPAVERCSVVLSSLFRFFASDNTTVIRLKDVTFFRELPDLRDFHSLLELDLLHKGAGHGAGVQGQVSVDKFPPQIEIIRVRRGNLEGGLPSLSSLTQLRVLILRNHVLSGTLSANLLPASLETLDLSFNDFHGFLPDFSSFPVLKRIRLEGNRFSGALVSARLPVSLAVLKLRWNLLSGAVPTTLSLLPLSTLHLAHNDWSCPVSDYSWVTHNDFANATSACPTSSATPQPTTPPTQPPMQAQGCFSASNYGYNAPGCGTADYRGCCVSYCEQWSANAYFGLQSSPYGSPPYLCSCYTQAQFQSATALPVSSCQASIGSPSSQAGNSHWAGDQFFVFSLE